MLHIALSGEELFSLLGFPVTNSLLTTWIVMILLAVLSLRLRAGLARIPGRFQLCAEIVLGGLLSVFESVLGEKARGFFAFLATLFIFIIASNWIGLLPGVGSITYTSQESHKTEIDHVAGDNHYEGSADHADDYLQDEAHAAAIPLLRAPTADLNTTFALAILAFVVLQVTGIRSLGAATYASKFINVKNPIYFFVGILEIVSEIGKVISFAFRLFGNIFAGEVLLAVIAFLIPILAPVPFLGLEIFVGFIQALVFAMLTAVFLAAASTHDAH